MREGYLTVDEMADELNISRATAWKWMRRHDLRTFRFMGDRKTYVRREDIDQLKQPIELKSTKKEAA